MRSVFAILLMGFGVLAGLLLLGLSVDLFVKGRTLLSLLTLTALMALGSVALNVSLDIRDAGRRRDG